MKQSYQELTNIVIEDLRELKKGGVETLDEIRKFYGKDVQEYFFDKKIENPERYQRLSYDTNGHIPFSTDLISILHDLRISGFLRDKLNIIE